MPPLLPSSCCQFPLPQRVVHGTADNIVPFEMSQRFAKASKNAKLIPLAGVGHFELIDPRAKVWPIIQKNILDWQFLNSRRRSGRSQNILSLEAFVLN